MSDDRISLRGVRVHNLKNIDLDIPRNQLVVITGLSGSGKSSLAFDTIYAEGQRRYVESLSAYARQFIGVLDKPEADSIEGLSPSISIEQKTVSHNPRSTVGTVTEIYDYLRLLYARAGTQFCHQCGSKVERQTTDQIIDAIMALPVKSFVTILAPVVKSRKGHYRELFEEFRKEGFIRARIDKQIVELKDGLKADRYKIHNIEIVIDRLTINASMRARLAESVELALKHGKGVVMVLTSEGELLYSKQNACMRCGISYDEAAPNMFSFNSPMGQCESCAGLGEHKKFDERLIFPDPSVNVAEGGIAPFGKVRSTYVFSQLRSVFEYHGYSFDQPLDNLPPSFRKILMNGGGSQQYLYEYRYPSGYVGRYKHRFDGILKMLRRKYEETQSGAQREWVESFMATSVCESCEGARLKKESLAIKLVDEGEGAEISISEIVNHPIRTAYDVCKQLRLSQRKMEIAQPIVTEIIERLRFLLDVGLDYLTLDRPARTLSGGEGQRIRLATQIGTQLVGVQYILDEPSIGLHQRDNIKLINSLKALRDLGNSVLVVEHDKEMIESADFIIDLGPGAGERGGEVVVTGKPADLLSGNGVAANSLTLDYLKGKKRIPIPDHRRKGNGKRLVLHGASGHNLKDLSLSIPLGSLVCVTGVSGSGKSSLINETLYPLLAKKLYDAHAVPLPFRSVAGIEYIDKVIEIDQTPIGRTPRSNPATYTGLFTHIRDLYAELPESRLRGYKPGRFSFNVKDGRCEECEGDGLKKIEMNFLPDVYVECSVCRGLRYNKQTLEVLYKGRSIADVLNFTVEDAHTFFFDIPSIRRKLETLLHVGLGYVRLGQQATTLSGGEAQRVKLSAELSKVGTGSTFYILDEPTTGLHFEDINMLMLVLNRLVEKGNTIVVIEHNLDVIKQADWIVDLGPEGGDRGGRIVAEGTPEKVAGAKDSFTGRFLNEFFNQQRQSETTPTKMIPVNNRRRGKLSPRKPGRSSQKVT